MHITEDENLDRVVSEGICCEGNCEVFNRQDRVCDQDIVGIRYDDVMQAMQHLNPRSIFFWRRPVIEIQPSSSGGMND